MTPPEKITARNAFDVAHAQAWTEYRDVVAPAWQKYIDTMRSAMTNFDTNQKGTPNV
jgi:hypothetical protein